MSDRRSYFNGKIFGEAGFLVWICDHEHTTRDQALLCAHRRMRQVARSMTPGFTERDGNTGDVIGSSKHAKSR
jgi:hypothetical protein